ncbi:MAG TPA: hypothetical protein VEC19_02795 [Usitatibacter sp.]|nr:hypothetical protein [Usitatibacter sp.]
MSVRLVASIVVLVLAASHATAQVTRVYLRKGVTHLQTGPATTTPITAYFNADVDGIGIGGIVSPVVTGPFNLGALGPQHNNGTLVYNPGDNGWRWGTGGVDFVTDSLSTVNGLFGDGTYTFSVNGNQVPLNLNGGSYPVVPVVTLAGGRWVDGYYRLDQDQPLTVTTNTFVGYGTFRNSVICSFFRGPGFLIPFQNVITECPGFLQRSSDTPNQSFMTYTVPASAFLPGEDYTLTTSFNAIVDTRTVAGLPGATNTARYITAANVKIKTSAPVFPMTVHASITPTSATASADILYRPEDVGKNGSVFVFALAPATIVSGADTRETMKIGYARTETKADTPIACVLAQLNAAGQMVAVTSANLAAYLTSVLGAQGASVSILNGVPTGNVSGATFFVGYGPSATTMINTGVNRAAVTIPGSLTCEPKAPQTGWWWNPLEDGRGFSLEVRGNNMFFASFLYDVSGRSNWYVSTGPVSLEGSLYNGDLLAASGGQTLGGAYSRSPTLANLGPMTLTFNNGSTGTLVWPGGTVPIQRFNIVPDGLTRPPVAGQPENGWWWNEQESGRGFFMEWQGGTLDIAGYMYDDRGDPVWYLTVGPIGGTETARQFQGNWWSYSGGQALTGAWRQNSRTDSNVAPLSITFSGPDTALMTLPNGRTTQLKRHRF